MVKVPVLSNKIVFALPVASKLSPDLNKMPSSEARPVPVMTAVGVAKPIAQGQAITRTATVLISARASRVGSSAPCIMIFCGAGGCTKNQTKKVIRAIPITIGTNTVEILSANC